MQQRASFLLTMTKIWLKGRAEQLEGAAPCFLYIVGFPLRSLSGLLWKEPVWPRRKVLWALLIMHLFRPLCLLSFFSFFLSKVTVNIVFHLKGFKTTMESCQMSTRFNISLSKEKTNQLESATVPGFIHILWIVTNRLKLTWKFEWNL